MINKNIFEYKQYTQLWPEEHQAIEDYMSNAPETLAEVLSGRCVLSEGMRLFLADMVTGKIKRKKGSRKNTLNRDFEIHEQVLELLNQGYKLTSGRTDGASAVVSEVNSINEDVVIKAYQRIKKKYDDYYGFVAKEEDA